MIITCPGCATRYQVPETAFDSDGRRVRCTACSFAWHAVPNDATPGISEASPDFDSQDFGAEDGSVDSEFDLAHHLAEAERLERNLAAFGHIPGRDAGRFDAHSGGRRQRLSSAWIALAASLALICGAAYEYREAVVRALPRTAALYDLAGLEVNIRGMEFANVVVEREYENGLPVLAVRGEIVNITGRQLDIPRLRFGLRDPSSQEIYHWTMAVSADRLAPEESTAFVTKLAAPPAQASDVEVRFYDIGNRRAGE